MVSLRNLPVLAALLLAMGKACAAPPQAAGKDAEILQGLRNTVSLSFALNKDLALAPGLRSAASAIADAHLARINALIPLWIQEAQGEAARLGISVYFPVLARVFNELALWHMERGNDTYEGDLLAVLMASPQVCDLAGDSRFNDFASRIMRIQAMPASRQGAALEAERTLLAHWGQARPAPPALPPGLPQDAAMAALQSAPQGEQRARALPPVLAAALRADKQSYERLPSNLRCALHQWWLQESIQRGTPPAAALAAFRYGTLITVTDRSAGTDAGSAPVRDIAAPSGKPRYPRLAGFFAAEGSTTIKVKLDAAGKAVEAHVVARKVTVPGIRDARPLAFETIFDHAALSHALKERRYEADPSPVFELAWKPAAPGGSK